MAEPETREKSVRVKMLSNIAGRPTYHAGEEVDLAPAIAKAWIADGLARPVREAPVERAVR